jgi:hypothetical protein
MNKVELSDAELTALIKLIGLESTMDQFTDEQNEMLEALAKRLSTIEDAKL